MLVSLDCERIVLIRPEHIKSLLRKRKAKTAYACKQTPDAEVVDFGLTVISVIHSFWI